MNAETALPPPLPEVAAFPAYEPQAIPEGTLRLDGNEGPWPSPELAAGLADELPRLARHYPDAGPLRALLAERRGVAPEQVLVTAGVDDAFDRIARAYLGAGRSAVHHEPTFEMVPRYVGLAGARAIVLPWAEGVFPADALFAALERAPTAVFLVTPNNPTGATIDEELLVEAAKRGRNSLVVVDLAYAEYAEEDPSTRLLEQPNVVVLRTLSKAWGLAGLRVGYALAAPEVVGNLRRVGGPYAVSALSLALAERWLEEGQGVVRAHCAAVTGERARLRELLEAAGARVGGSQANFVLARHPQAAALKAALQDRAIAVRAWPGRPGLEDALRITCPGEPELFGRLEAALAAALTTLEER